MTLPEIKPAGTDGRSVPQAYDKLVGLIIRNRNLSVVRNRLGEVTVFDDSFGTELLMETTIARTRQSQRIPDVSIRVAFRNEPPPFMFITVNGQHPERAVKIVEPRAQLQPEKIIRNVGVGLEMLDAFFATPIELRDNILNRVYDELGNENPDQTVAAVNSHTFALVQLDVQRRAAAEKAGIPESDWSYQNMHRFMASVLSRHCSRSPRK